MPAPTRQADGGELDAGRTVCSPGRGTGKVVSGLGGEPHEITCPWCGGSGRFVSGRDAQTGTVTASADDAAE